MDRWLRGFIIIERSLQMVMVVGVLIFLAYLGLTNTQRHPPAPAPNHSSTLSQ
ncbi:hypothetical protein [Alkalinema sp. FACHB-956]|uniref:hypothetical protein n=1 Tax=Alkalinema sp. FACHB-956 TaxID=2692768 RepID=UPI0016896CAD|nr:hypothetical protein [Alkalinema sp. FACHB-956]MBD2327761.1 hypothetical protein [Alkalinema sp. FACHB-956]